jgi:GR25 family glycosyltransferase involved in LPS biosynthesis
MFVKQIPVQQKVAGPMDVFYINLAEQAERRAFVEDSFRAANDRDWRLHRIEAITPRTPGVSAVAGPIRDVEKACFLSHIEAVRASMAHDGHALIAEDDIQFGQKSFATIENMLAKMRDDSWDLVYTDILIPDIHTMVECVGERRKAEHAGAPKLINLKDVRFFGATAYIVNRHSKHKVLSLLTRDGAFQRPYDLHLLDLIRGGVLRAFVLFPFATTVSLLGAQSQIQTDETRSTELIWTVFRRLMWAERDLGRSMEEAEKTAAGVSDAETIALSRLFTGMMTPDFKYKKS